MASVSYELSSLNYYVFQPQNIIPETHHPPPSFTQIDLTLSLNVIFNGHYCITDQFFDVNDTNPLLRQEILRFDLDVLKNHDQASEILAPALTRVGLKPTSRRFASVIDDIIEHGLRIGNTHDKGLKVLPLSAELWATILMHVNSEDGLINGALSESASEFEASNYGMVPAKESSIKQMLKKVSVEVGQEDCSICLEELKVGLKASQMPCSHSFHGDCIEKWLKQSHYCPICRFEMPT